MSRSPPNHQYILSHSHWKESFMNKFKKLKSAIISFCKPKKLTSLAVALTTIFAILPVANISASAYSYTGLSEIGGKVLIQSSKNPLVLMTTEVQANLTHINSLSTVRSVIVLTHSCRHKRQAARLWSLHSFRVKQARK